jgi:hypothetical protein
MISCGCSAKNVFVIDARRAGFDETLLYTSLQGLANRDGPSVFVLFEDRDTVWVDYYSRELGYKFQVSQELTPLLDCLREHVNGYIVWDPSCVHSANVAMTIAGLENLIVVGPGLEEAAIESKLVKKADLRGKFSGWDRYDIYDWAAREYIRECNSNLIAGLTVPNQVDLDLTPLLGWNRTIMLRFGDSDSRDGNGAKLKELFLFSPSETLRVRPGTTEENRFLVDRGKSWLDRDGDRIADRDQSFAYRFAIPPGDEWARISIYVENQYRIVARATGGLDSVVAASSELSDPVHNHIRDYLVMQKSFVFDLSANPADQRGLRLKSRLFDEVLPGGTVFGWTARGESEAQLVGLASEKSLTVLCSQGAPNFSFHSKVARRTEHVDNFFTPPRLDAKRIYICFIGSDGDALHRLSNFHAGQWLSEERGRTPMGWETQLLLGDLAPAMLDYYMKTATPNDELVASASGIGYFFPSRMPEADLKTFLERTRNYLDSAGFSSLVVISRDDVEDRIADLYSSALGDRLLGCFEGYYHREAAIRFLPGLVWMPTTLPCSWVKDKGDLEMGISLMRRLKQQGEPMFIMVHPNFNRISVGDIASIAERLDASLFSVVAPSELLSLLREYEERMLIRTPRSASVIEGAKTYVPVQLRNRSGYETSVTARSDAGSAGLAVGRVGPNRGIEDSIIVDGAAREIKLEFKNAGGDTSLTVMLDVVRADSPPPDRCTFIKSYESELLSHRSGRLTEDREALNGFAWTSGVPTSGAQHIVYGPYERLPAGRYVAYFRAKRSREGQFSLTLEVSNRVEGGVPEVELLAARDVPGSDLVQGQYVYLGLPFTCPGRGSLEYRVLYGGESILNVDRIALFEIQR